MYTTDNESYFLQARATHFRHDLVINIILSRTSSRQDAPEGVQPSPDPFHWLVRRGCNMFEPIYDWYKWDHIIWTPPRSHALVLALFLKFHARRTGSLQLHHQRRHKADVLDPPIYLPTIGSLGLSMQVWVYFFFGQGFSEGLPKSCKGCMWRKCCTWSV